jgi:hypothetical protein
MLFALVVPPAAYATLSLPGGPDPRFSTVSSVLSTREPGSHSSSSEMGAS